MLLFDEIRALIDNTPAPYMSTGARQRRLMVQATRRALSTEPLIDAIDAFNGAFQVLLFGLEAKKQRPARIAETREYLHELLDIIIEICRLEDAPEVIH